MMLVAKINALPFSKKETYFRNIKLAIGKYVRQETIRPSFLVIQTIPHGFQLRRYSTKGERVGDSSHDSIESAQQRAEYEFDGHYSEWYEVPLEMQNSISSVLAHFATFETIYRVLLTVEKIPPHLGYKSALSVTEGFMRRPWSKNVLCFWDKGTSLLYLRADHPCDDKGVIVGTELAEEIAAFFKMRYVDERTIRIIYVKKMTLPEKIHS